MKTFKLFAFVSMTITLLICGQCEDDTFRELDVVISNKTDYKVCFMVQSESADSWYTTIISPKRDTIYKSLGQYRKDRNSNAERLKEALKTSGVDRVKIKYYDVETNVCVDSTDVFEDSSEDGAYELPSVNYSFFNINCWNTETLSFDIIKND